MPIDRREGIFQDIYVVTGSAVAIQFMTGSFYMAKFQANANNIGTFLLGSSPTTMLWELDAGDETLWIPLGGDINILWHQNISGTFDYLNVWAVR